MYDCPGPWHHPTWPGGGITSSQPPLPPYKQPAAAFYGPRSGLTRGPCLTFETELENLHQAVFINLIIYHQFEINSLNVLVSIVPDLNLAQCAVMIRLEALVPCTGELWPGLAGS